MKRYRQARNEANHSVTATMWTTSVSWRKRVLEANKEEAENTKEQEDKDDRPVSNARRGRDSGFSRCRLHTNAIHAIPRQTGAKFVRPLCKPPWSPSPTSKQIAKLKPISSLVRDTALRNISSAPFSSSFAFPRSSAKIRHICHAVVVLGEVERWLGSLSPLWLSRCHIYATLFFADRKTDSREVRCGQGAGKRRASTASWFTANVTSSVATRAVHKRYDRKDSQSAS